MEKPIKLGDHLETTEKIRERSQENNINIYDIIKPFQIREAILLTLPKEKRDESLKILNNFFKENPGLDNTIVLIKILSGLIDNPEKDYSDKKDLIDQLNNNFKQKDIDELGLVLNNILIETKRGPSGGKFDPSYNRIHRAEQEYNGREPGSYQASWE